MTDNQDQSISQDGGDFQQHLIQQLKEKSFARKFLQQAINQEEQKTIFLALKLVADAQGGISKLSQTTKLSRPSLYRSLSEDGNPNFETLQSVLKALGFKLTIQ